MTIESNQKIDQRLEEKDRFPLLLLLLVRRNLANDVSSDVDVDLRVFFSRNLLDD